MPPLGVEYTERFRDEARQLADEPLDRLDAALRELRTVFGQPHRHAGLGIRRLKRNYFEFRVGRDLRVVFTLEGSTAILRTVGNHDQVRAYLKQVWDQAPQGLGL